MIDERALRAIEASDTDELIRVVDGYAAGRMWEQMAALRKRCDEAVTRGKQVWAISEYVRYRFALDGPGEWAGPVVSEGESRFTLGPLPEVAASTKTWRDLEPHLGPGPHRALTAHERVVRGEALEEADIDPLVMDLPLRLSPWEPSYPLATYRSDRVEAPSPPHRSPGVAPLEGGGEAMAPDDGTRALLSVVEHWVETSNGRAQARCVDGNAGGAVKALGITRAGLEQVEPQLALAWIAWAAADGGAHGRRRGAAAGRFNAWWAAGELAGLEWPPDPDELGEAVAALRWFLWSDGSPDTGWSLRVAIEAGDGRAWALSAVDAD
ncbi:MAG: DUF6183 family protein [Actinomycetota bacterium]